VSVHCATGRARVDQYHESNKPHSPQITHPRHLLVQLPVRRLLRRQLGRQGLQGRLRFPDGQHLRELGGLLVVVPALGFGCVFQRGCGVCGV
jgi:hypothetical protein